MHTYVRTGRRPISSVGQTEMSVACLLLEVFYRNSCSIIVQLLNSPVPSNEYFLPGFAKNA